MQRIELSKQGDHFVTRREGELVRGELRKFLGTVAAQEPVEISLAGLDRMTPSFVDECLGKLLLELGADEFRRRVVLSGADPTTKTLVNAVLSKRARESQVAG